METLNNESVESRRDFLKKVAYAAPAVVALGALNAHAMPVPVSCDSVQSSCAKTASSLNVNMIKKS